MRPLCHDRADLADYADPQTTAETLRSDGWQHTGDVGKLVNGQLYITDRCAFAPLTPLISQTQRRHERVAPASDPADSAEVKGFQVAPSELEDVLCGLPELVDAGVTSIYSTEDASEYPRAYVVPRDPALIAAVESGLPIATPELLALADRIKQHTEARLIKYKQCVALASSR